MPYKCVHCEKIYEDGSRELLSGCTECHSKFFFYIKKEKIKELENKKQELELDKNEKEQIEKDIRDIAGIEDGETPVFLDFESIKIVKPGKYLLDIAKLFDSGTPKIYQLEDGKYIVDLSNSFAKKEKTEYKREI